MTDDRRRGRRDTRDRGRSAGRGSGPADGPIPGYDLYAVLGVRPEATHQEILEAASGMDGRLRTAAAKDRPGATARLKRVNVARHWLTDPTRRRTYDAARSGAAAGGASTAGGRRVRARVGAGSATRRGSTGSSGLLSRPLTWIGAAAVVLIAGFLVLGPGGLGGTGASASGSPSSGAGGSAGAGGIPAGCPTAQPPAAPKGQQELATIATTKGTIEVTLVADLSPIAVGNFTALAQCGYYDGVVFHRVVPNFVIQGGDGQYGRISSYSASRVGSGGPGYAIQDEPVTTTYRRGTVAMARTSQPNSADAQFFIVLSDDAQGSLQSANTYQIIGSVTKGMDVVDAIAAAADAEKPSQPVAMTSVKISPTAAASGAPSSAGPSASSIASSPSASTAASPR